MGRHYMSCPECAELHRRLRRLRWQRIANTAAPFAGILAGVIVYVAIR